MGIVDESQGRSMDSSSIHDRIILHSELRPHNVHQLHENHILEIVEVDATDERPAFGPIGLLCHGRACFGFGAEILDTVGVVLTFALVDFLTGVVAGLSTFAFALDA